MTRDRYSVVNQPDGVTMHPADDGLVRSTLMQGWPPFKVGETAWLKVDGQIRPYVFMGTDELSMLWKPGERNLSGSEGKPEGETQ